MVLFLLEHYLESVHIQRIKLSSRIQKLPVNVIVNVQLQCHDRFVDPCLWDEHGEMKK